MFAPSSSTTFDSAGPMDAPAIVLVHGSVVTRKMWAPQLRGLAGPYRVIAPDLPGHGALAGMPFSFDATVDCLAELILQEAHGSALIAGLSLGGFTAIELASRRPELVSGLVLTGSSFNFTGLLGVYIKIASALMMRGWLRQSSAQAEKKVRAMFPAALLADADAQIQAGVYPDALGPSFAEMAGRDFTVPLGRYLGPVLILNGENDSTARRGEAKFLAVLRQGRTGIVPGAGHAANLDQPEAYNQALLEFARSIGWTAAHTG